MGDDWSKLKTIMLYDLMNKKSFEHTCKQSLSIISDYKLGLRVKAKESYLFINDYMKQILLHKIIYLL